MGKKGRKGADDWEKDFELDDEGNLAALKQGEPAEEAAPAAGKCLLAARATSSGPAGAAELCFNAVRSIPYVASPPGGL